MPLIASRAGGSAIGFGGLVTFGAAYAGPFGAYDALATVTLSTATASVSFAGIPSGYKHLQIRGIAKANRTTYVDDLGIRFNGDTTSNYSWHRTYGFGSGAGSSDSGVSQTSMNIGQIAGGTVNNAQGFGAVLVDLLDYSNINKYKTIKYFGGYDDNGQGAIQFASGNWRDLSVVSSITLLPLIGTTFSQYTKFALYGVK